MNETYNTSDKNRAYQRKMLRYRGQVIVIVSKAILRYIYQQQIQHEDLKYLEDRE